MIEKCQVKILSNKVICDNKIENNKDEKKRDNEHIKNKKKYNHLVDIGMDMEKYHPTIIRNMVDGGRITKIPDNIKHQIVDFTTEAHQKGFNPALFGYNTALHKSIKKVHNIPKRKYVMKGNGQIKENEIIIKHESSSTESDSETDIDVILSDVEKDLKNNNIKDVKIKLKQYRHKIPVKYYNSILKSIK